MTIPPDVDPARDGVDDSATLLAQFRSGDQAVGYELLGRQASVDQWKAVLSAFAADPAGVDLERVAGSTLGRQPDVLTAVLELLEANGSGHALFIAHATASLRNEPHLVERATRCEQALLEKNLGLLEDGDDEAGLASLYLLLSQPLRAQRENWILWAEALPSKAEIVKRALVSEDERLQRLSKERSYRAGSYLHFLRHAVANFVLVAGIGGPIGKRAFALLQRRVDDVEQQADLLQVVPEETRRRYLEWSLEPRNSDVVLRTRFALRMVREYFPDAASADQLLRLCAAADPGVAADAAVTALATGVGSRAINIEIARQLNVLDPEDAERLASALVEVPSRIELGLVDPARRGLLFAHGASHSSDFCPTIASQLLQLPAAEVPDVVASVAQLPEAVASDDALAELASGLLSLATADHAYWPALVGSLNQRRFRAAAWTVLPAANEDRRGALIVALIDAETPDTGAELAIEALRIVEGGEQQALAELLLEMLFERKLDAEVAAAAWPVEFYASALAAAEETRRRSEHEREKLEGQLALGEKAYLADLRREMEPLITRALGRATGNAGLQDGYARLAAALGAGDTPVATQERETNEAASPSRELPASTRDELSNVGARFDPDSSTVAFDGEPADASTRLRYLGVLDQRARRTRTGAPHEAGSQPLMHAYVTALGDLGLAEEALQHLFTGGRLLPIVVQLSPATRQVLLEAAQTNAFEPPASWHDHPALGEWLRAIQLQARGETSGREIDAAMLRTAFRLTQETVAACEAARIELDQQHHTAREAFARRTIPVFDEIDSLVDSYAQLWQGLSRLGIRQIAPLGLVIGRDTIDPERHEIVGEADATEFIVRSPGFEIDGEVLLRARLEGVVA